MNKESISSKEVFSSLEKVRIEKPLIHHITNWVTIYDCANIVKIFGASPVMAHAKEEAADMTKIASALVLNIGTLTNDLIETMIISAKTANEKGIPVILDVCGAGATKYRDEKCLEIFKNCKIDIIKGNASEVARIAGEEIKTKGVDSTDINKDLMIIAKTLAGSKNCTVVITGKDDFISDGNNSFIVKNGNIVMSKIVGTGCMAASVIGTFASVQTDKNYTVSSVYGLSCYEIAAEIASINIKGSGNFKEELFNCIEKLNQNQIENKIKVEVIN